MNHLETANATRALDKYIHMMTGKAHAIRVDIADFNVPDARLDDAYSVHVRGGKGEVLATNPRAALIAAYHLLRVNGCGFTRPGASGEVVPRGMRLDDICADLRVENAHRFRGICIEGAVSLGVALDMLEWMPKAGFNTYFMQFREGFTFFDRFYSERHNPSRMPVDFNLGVSRDIANRVASKARELGLAYHGVGHGFHVECFGIPGLSWEMNPGAWPKEYEFAMAQLASPSVRLDPQGKEEPAVRWKPGDPPVRAMHWDMPMITALCYENPEVQNIFAEKAAEYIAASREYDCVHIWLDDGGNNKCECGLCGKTRIADSYVKLLNKVDALLTKAGCKTKIVFLAYTETLWPPETEVLKNPPRFTFMFAPIARNPLEPLWRVEADGPMLPYTLNKMPSFDNLGKIISHLDAWNAWRKKNGMDMADSFDFDYYVSKFADPGQFTMARTIYDDVLHLRARGLNGVVNCQQQCLFADAALSMNVLGATLLQPERPFDDIADEFFRGAFGAANAAKFRRHFEALTDASTCLRAKASGGSSTEGQVTGPGGFAVDAAGLAGLGALLDAPPPEYANDNIGVAESVRLLKFTQALFRGIVDFEKAKTGGNEGEINSAREAAGAFATRRAAEFETAFDPGAFLHFLNRKQG